MKVARIDGNLWMGSKPARGDTRLRDFFDVVVLCAEEVERKDYELPGVHIMRVPLDDIRSSPQAMQELALRAGRDVAVLLARGARVLVTCNAGLNRSGLVTAIALIERGFSAYRAVNRIRRQRGREGDLYPLCNPTFVEMIVAYEQRRLRAA